MPPVQGVVDHKALEHGTKIRAPGEEDAAVTDITDAPEAAAREESEAEADGFREAGGGQSGAPW